MGQNSLHVIPITDILSLVRMIPHPQGTDSEVPNPEGDMFYVVEKMRQEVESLQNRDGINLEDEQTTKDFTEDVE